MINGVGACGVHEPTWYARLWIIFHMQGSKNQRGKNLGNLYSWGNRRKQSSLKTGKKKAPHLAPSFSSFSDEWSTFAHLGRSEQRVSFWRLSASPSTPDAWNENMETIHFVWCSFEKKFLLTWKISICTIPFKYDLLDNFHVWWCNQYQKGIPTELKRK
jgi:hypothetical protein